MSFDLIERVHKFLKQRETADLNSANSTQLVENRSQVDQDATYESTEYFPPTAAGSKKAHNIYDDVVITTKNPNIDHEEPVEVIEHSNCAKQVNRP